MIYCRAFARQPCRVGGYLASTTVCCRECEEFTNCEARCNNGPERCNKSEIGEVEQPKGRGNLARKIGQYDSKGDQVAVHRSVQKAADAAGVSKYMVYSAIDMGKPINGYIWKYEE